MQKIKPAGAEMESAGRNAVRIVFAVSENRAPCMGKLDADLVVAPGVQMNRKPAETLTILCKFAQNLIVQQCLFGIGRIR